jgi:hypothetical protein
MADGTPHDADRFRNLLAFALIGAFIAVVPLFVFKTIPTDNKEIIVYMVGQLSGMATTALGFYFVTKAGQDALDTKRAETTGKMADAVVAAANSTPLAADGLNGEPRPAGTEGDPVHTKAEGEE